VREGEPPGWLVVAAERSGSELRVALPGESVAVGEATWTTVSVGAASALAEGAAEEGRDGVGDGSAENDASVVGVAEVHPARGEGRDGRSVLRVLLAGDAEPAGQARALRSAALLDLDLSADVLKLPHHGSARQEPRFFAASGASLAVASAGADNDYGHPAKAALDLAAANGMAVARTDTQGTILVARADAALRITTSRRGSLPGRRGSPTRRRRLRE
jgi:competence protein ComEC